MCLYLWTLYELPSLQSVCLQSIPIYRGIFTSLSLTQHLYKFLNVFYSRAMIRYTWVTEIALTEQELQPKVSIVSFAQCCKSLIKSAYILWHMLKLSIEIPVLKLLESNFLVYLRDSWNMYTVYIILQKGDRLPRYKPTEFLHEPSE